MLLLDIIVSGFAAWGLFCALKFFADGFITPKSARPRPAVRISGDEDIKLIAELCENAGKAVICNRGEVLLVLSAKHDDAAARLRRELDSMGLCNVGIVYEGEKDD